MKSTLFKMGDYGYDNFRIPAILSLPENKIIVFCEGRPTMSDTGKISVVARISRDGGKTFEQQFMIAQEGENTLENPCPVFDRDTGTIWLFLSWNAGNTKEAEIIQKYGKRRVFLTHSNDLGETWSPIKDMTSILSRENWTWYATGPCHGLQMKSGRIIIPCDHGVFPLVDNDVYKSMKSHIIYSDDHGKSWHIGTELNSNTTECCVAEIRNNYLT